MIQNSLMGAATTSPTFPPPPPPLFSSSSSSSSSTTATFSTTPSSTTSTTPSSTTSTTSSFKFLPNLPVGFSFTQCIWFKQEILICGGWNNGNCYSYHTLKCQYKLICTYPKTISSSSRGHAIIPCYSSNSIHCFTFNSESSLISTSSTTNTTTTTTTTIPSSSSSSSSSSLLQTQIPIQQTSISIQNCKNNNNN